MSDGEPRRREADPLDARLHELDASLAALGASMDEHGSTRRGEEVRSGGAVGLGDDTPNGVRTEWLDGDDVAASANGAPELGAGRFNAATDAGADGSSDPVDVDKGDQPSAAARRRRAVLDWVYVIAVALLVAFLVRTFVLAHFVVEGTSMSSTLSNGDRVFVNKLSYRLHDPNRGDVVVLHELMGATERDLIKRVIALPGETVEVQNCQVTIDGGMLTEPYLDPPAMTPGQCGPDMAELTIPADHVFVMGDNRGFSMDSRALGPIPEDELVGRAFVVFWPTDHWTWL